MWEQKKVHSTKYFLYYLKWDISMLYLIPESLKKIVREEQKKNRKDKKKL